MGNRTDPGGSSPEVLAGVARRLPDSETVIFEHSGHVPWLDEPDAFLDAVVDWLHRRALA